MIISSTPDPNLIPEDWKQTLAAKKAAKVSSAALGASPVHSNAKSEFNPGDEVSFTHNGDKVPYGIVADVGSEIGIGFVRYVAHEPRRLYVKVNPVHVRKFEIAADKITELTKENNRLKSDLMMLREEHQDYTGDDIDLDWTSRKSLAEFDSWEELTEQVESLEIKVEALRQLMVDSK